jgi:tetratricopeptide (TPR) repeat protein
MAQYSTTARDFFISYNKADRHWATWIAWQLEAAGFSTLLQAWDFRPGCNFVLEMQAATTAARRTIAVLSPDYLDALYTQPEWAAAFLQDPTGSRGLLVPVRVRECDLRGLLAAVVYIDLVGRGEEDACQVLLAGVSAGRAKPEAAPEFPVLRYRAAPETAVFPGRLPVIWNVPYDRNSALAGREDAINRLRHALTSRESGSRVQALHGLGGVGKTQLAVEYAYRYAASYDLVWWTRAEDAATIAADLAALADQLGLPHRTDRNQREVTSAVLRKLEQITRWLLVFDNAAEPDTMREFLPRLVTGEVIITSRNPAWRGMAEPFAITVLEAEPAVRFLQRRAGLQDESATRELAAETGYLPLALEQAGAYIEASGIGAAEYLELYRSRRRELWRHESRPRQYRDTVSMTWAISIDSVKRANPAAMDMLELAACLAPEDIPLQLLRDGSLHLPDPLRTVVADPLLVNDAVALLRRYSLVDSGGGAISVHRLVQAVVSDMTPPERWAGCVSAAAEVVGAAFGGAHSSTDNWRLCDRLLNHALRVAEHARQAGIAGELRAALSDAVGSYLMERSQFAMAEPLLAAALSIREETMGKVHPLVADSLTHIGLLHFNRAEYGEAESCYRRALEMRHAALGDDHLDVAVAMSNLGRTYTEEGKLTDAESMLAGALAVADRVAPDVQQTAKVLADFSYLRFLQGRCRESESLAERALAVTTKVAGSASPELLYILNSLAMAVEGQGRLVDAEAVHKRAMPIAEATFGDWHPNVARILVNLGILYDKQKRYSDARSAYERACAIFAGAYGPDHVYVAACINNMAESARTQGDLVEAERLYRRALGLFEKTLGPRHPNAATCCTSLGDTLRGQQRWSDAEPLYDRAIGICRQTLGPDHPELARALCGYGGLLRDTGRAERAEEAYNEALAVYEKDVVQYKPEVIDLLEDKARLSEIMGRPAEARSLFARAAQLRAAPREGGGACANAAR